MAKRRKRRSSRTSKKQEYPGWAWGIWGLTIGLSVAAAVWVSDRKGAQVGQPVARQAASLNDSLDNNGESEAAGKTQAEPKKNRFDFYTMLPNFELIIPEEDTEVAADVEPEAIVVAGTYVLQAGSFTTYEDADRRRANLAMHGIESNIQRVSIDDRTYHRVRISATKDLDELNMTRSRLRAANIDVLIIRLAD